MNNCITFYFFEGPEDEIAQLYKFISKYDNSESSLNDIAREVFAGENFEPNVVFENGKLNTVIRIDKNQLYFITETLYEPFTELWETKITDFANTYFLYTSKNKIDSIFRTNDENHIFFKNNKYFVEIIGDAEYYPANEKELFDLIKTFTQTTVTDKQQMCKAIELHNTHRNKKTLGYIIYHEFQLLL